VRVDYDSVSGRYDRSRSFDSAFTERLKAALPADFWPRRALDAGCGTGNATRCAMEAFPGAAVVGLDLSAGMLGKARGKLAGLPLVRGDAARLPFSAGAFDLVLSTYVLHHLDGPGGYCAEAARVLASGGRLALLTAGHAQIRAHFLNDFFPRFGDIDCGRFPTLDEVEAAMRAAGLDPGARREMPVAEYAVDERYLERLAARHISTFELMSDAEFAEGLERITAWVRAGREGGREMPRHSAMGTLLVAAKG
jgi:ubiquinone/menaquinone biosynthesis C-methylase UbiE